MTRLGLKRSVRTANNNKKAAKVNKKQKSARDYEEEDYSGYEEHTLPLPPVSAQSFPDRVIAVQKAQIRAGRKVELKLDELLRTRFRSIDVSLNFVPEIHENERHYIPQPCPKVWKKLGSKTSMGGTAESHLAILKEIKKGNTITQVNACVIGKITDPATGERTFFTNYILVIRLEAIEGPNVVLPFEVTVVTSHNGGNNTSVIDIPRSLGLPYEEVTPACLPSNPLVSVEAFSSGLYEEIQLSPFSHEQDSPGDLYYDYDIKDETTPEPETHSVTLLVEDDAAVFDSPHAFLLPVKVEEEEVQEEFPISMDELLDWVEIPREIEDPIISSTPTPNPNLNLNNPSIFLEFEAVVSR